MTLFKRLVIAVEKIAEKQPMNAETLQAILEKALTQSTVVEEHLKRARQQEQYFYLKAKQAEGKELTEEEMKGIEYGDYQVTAGKLKEFAPTVKKEE